MSEHVTPERQAAHPAGHVVPVKVYLGVFLALCVLTVTTVSAHSARNTAT